MAVYVYVSQAHVRSRTRAEREKAARESGAVTYTRGISEMQLGGKSQFSDLHQRLKRLLMSCGASSSLISLKLDIRVALLVDKLGRYE